MNRKLLILDVVLGAAVIYGGLQLHSQWTAAKARQAQIPGPPVSPAPPPVMTPLRQEPAVLPSGYKKIAVETLFDPSRNPNIPVDPPPPPPPPREPPPLPSFHGSMDLGDGPTAMMSESGETVYREVRPGGMIGPFKLLSFSRREFEVEWEGRVIHKRVEEGGGEKARSNPQGVEPITTGGVIPGVAAPQQPQQQAPRGAELGPGAVVTDTLKACQAGDSSPVGAMVDGYRKDVRMTALGTPQCRWTLVGK